MKGDTYTYVFQCEDCEDWHEDEYESLDDLEKWFDEMRLDKDEPVSVRITSLNHVVPLSQFLLNDLNKQNKN